MANNNEKNINLAIDGDLWRDVGVYAMKNDKKKKEVVAMALLSYMSKDANKGEK